jgi:hypothetical protein
VKTETSARERRKEILDSSKRIQRKQNVPEVNDV